jgi:hypothetical protein
VRRSQKENKKKYQDQLRNKPTQKNQMKKEVKWRKNLKKKYIIQIYIKYYTTTITSVNYPIRIVFVN